MINEGITMISDKITTITLRFRDLSKDTIALHKKIIDKKGFVWWGWWAKPEETVANSAFVKLKNISNSENKLELFLLDSGKTELRKAICSDIVFDDTEIGTVIKSPQKNATPTYYAKNKYMIWFKLEKISNSILNANEFINNYTYLCVDEHFVSGSSPFSAFNNKRVFNLREMLEQQCTVWYLRNAEESDANRQIVSYAPGSGPFDGVFSIARDNKILWLSDLHFSDSHHAFKNSVGSNNSLFNMLKDRLDIVKFNKFSRIIVSGDFTFKSSASEFSEAHKFLYDMSSAYSISPSSLILCPGNHDMAYSKEDYKDDSEVVLTYSEAKANYIDFYEKTRQTRSNEFNNSIQRFISSNGQLIEIITLNTCILQQDRQHFRGMGYVGTNQLDVIKKDLKNTSKMNSTRILVMHHHLLPVAFSEKPQLNPMYSMLLDSESIIQFCLSNNITIVLHGHTHQNYYSELLRPFEKRKKKITIIGLGSTGAVRNDLTDGYNNQFATIIFESESICIKIYEIMNNGNNLDDKPIAEYTIEYGEIV